jgi:tetratricopeptide (TPR) repeat protein
MLTSTLRGFSIVRMGLLPIMVVAVVLLALAIALIVAVSARKGGVSGTRGKRPKDKSQILKEANRRLASNPKDVEALAALGSMAWDDRDWERAFKLYGTIYEAGSKNPKVDEFEVASRYGIAALNLKPAKMDEAYRALMAARGVKHDDFEVNYRLGVLEYRKKAYENALVLFKATTEAQPDHAAALRYLGSSFFKIKSYKEALIALRKALEIEPDVKESLFAAAECHYELGNLEQALKIFYHLRADPVFGPQASLFAGTVHLKQRLFERAAGDFELGLKHRNSKIETVVELKYRLAVAALNMQDIGKAVGLLDEIQAASPDYKDVPALLVKYKELNSSRNFHMYLLGSTGDFVTLCRKIALLFFPKAKVKIIDISVEGNDWADILAEIETAKWSDLILFRFIRAQGTMGEISLRDFHARIKDLKAGKGYCITAGSFSDEAKRFVEARLIDLIEKPELIRILNSITHNEFNSPIW